MLPGSIFRMKQVWSSGFSFLLFVLLSCSPKKKIASAKDYERFLDPSHITEAVKRTAGELSFWSERLRKDPDSYVNLLELGRYSLQRFQLTGDIAALQQGDSLLKAASRRLNNTDPEILFALSQNSISLHQFKTALSYRDAAEKAKGDKYTLCLLQFDAAMELGQFTDAYRSLQSLKDKTSFDYLIRLSKWEDQQGDLASAISLMEQAMKKVRSRNALYCWALSNLGDMYGHAGRVEDAYRAYLEVLANDPSDFHCLQGIAWIAYSHDQDPKAAEKILQFILANKKQPELLLTLAEIAGVEGKREEKERLEQAFIDSVSSPMYGAMYNKYLIPLVAERGMDPGRAITMAGKELENRFTPETCDWMAWAYYLRGDLDSAYNYSKNYVYRHTYEPEAMLHTAMIFSAKGRKAKAQQLLEECLESSFELGPVKTAAIREQLKKLLRSMSPGKLHLTGLYGNR